MNLINFVPFVIVFITFIFIAFLIAWLRKQDEGSQEMRDVALAVKQGAVTFLKREYKSIVLVFINFMHV